MNAQALTDWLEVGKRLLAREDAGRDGTRFRHPPPCSGAPVKPPRSLPPIWRKPVPEKG